MLSRKALLLVMALAVPVQAMADWPVLAEGGRETDRVVDPADLFQEVDVVWDGAPIVSDVTDLATVARSTADTRDRRAGYGRPAPHGMLGELGVRPDDVQRTLRFVQQIAEEDRHAPVQRLTDPAWIAAHFRVLKMHPDAQEAASHRVRLTEDRLRLTRYLVYRFPGSEHRTPAHDTALYRVPNDESPTTTGSIGTTLLRMALSRKEVLDGAFESEGPHAGRAEPLVYLSREHVHQALLQGTVQVELPNGDVRTYAVHKNNGRSFRRGVSAENQERMWYFRETETDPTGGANSGTQLRPGVSVAGDVNNLGLGGLYALQADDGTLRLVVMADTGGAFQPNLYQMDLFSGTHESLDALNEATADVPRRPWAYLLVLRDGL